MSINILYDYYFDFYNQIVTIGGIQTYIHNLVGVCRKLGQKVSVFQIGEEDNRIIVEGYEIISVRLNKSTDYQSFSDKVAALTDSVHDCFVFATDAIIPKINPFVNSIAIQHGINWDMPRSRNRNPLVMQLLKARRNYVIMRKASNVRTMICVDYNYVNWMRAQSDRVNTKLEVIPNFTRIAPSFNKPSDSVNIIFARRLWWYRGTRVFTEAIQRVLSEYNNISVTIAGDGPDKEWMRDKLLSFPNVHFIQYNSEDSIIVHADKHIAVIPTVGSEGTSLSLLEAMSSQCAVVASDVGGMTNIVLDGYNGLLVPAGNEGRLYDAIRFLIDNPKERERISSRGYDTVVRSFSYDKWANRWEAVIKDFVSNAN